MQNKPIHIVSFDNPFPPNYGGVIDVFFKVKALHALGFKIYLHCFYDERNKVSDALKSLTEEVYLYKKNRNIFFFFSAIPFGIKSRFHKSLVDNIAKNEAPLFFEGLQSTMMLNKVTLNNKKYLRLHNLESNFYSGMSSSETNWIKKIAYFFEAKKYNKYQMQLDHFDHVFALSEYEFGIVKTSTSKVTYIPVFHGNDTVKALSEFGNYAFYHGDLRLPDNKRAVQFLVTVFKEIPEYQLIIASSNGQYFVENLSNDIANIEFVKIESENHLDTLFENAHINVMLSFQKSGTKLKVINSLFKSRFCLINLNMIDDKNILKLCEVATTKDEFISKIMELKNKPFIDFEYRAKVLLDVLNDSNNAKKISNIITD